MVKRETCNSAIPGLAANVGKRRTVRKEQKTNIERFVGKTRKVQYCNIGLAANFCKRIQARHMLNNNHVTIDAKTTDAYFCNSRTACQSW